MYIDHITVQVKKIVHESRKMSEKVKTCDDVSRIMEMLAVLTKGKQNEGASNP